MEGIDEEPVSAWLDANIDSLVPPFSFELIAGGRSNLTYKVSDSAGHQVVLRRPPAGHVLPTAHDMGREYRVVTALGPTPVPVARTLGFCADPGVTGAPFYVMELVRGHVLRDPEIAEKAFDEPPGDMPESPWSMFSPTFMRSTSTRSGSATLAGGTVTSPGSSSAGTGSSRSPRSTASTARSTSTACTRRSLRPSPPRGGRIVHGDYRLDNTMLDDEGSVTAVLDWEICTLGDPLADVGLLMVYWTDPGDEFSALGSRLRCSRVS